jgi:hypothetical protein
VRAPERYGLVQALVPWTPRRVTATGRQRAGRQRATVAFASTGAAGPGMATVEVTALPENGDDVPVRARLAGAAVRLPSVVRALAHQRQPAVPFTLAAMGKVDADGLW